MTDPHAEALREAGERRAEHFARLEYKPGEQARSAPVAYPLGVGRRVSTKDLGAPAQLRARPAERDGKPYLVVEGYYTIYERGYEMYDVAGPYTEIVTRGAADKTTATQPDVVYLINHTGLALARTTAGTLELWSDETGGGNRAWLNPNRQDVKDLVAAIDDKTITEQSFAFMIDDGKWSEDFTEFRINAFSIDRGDTSAVNYGANPYTSVAARSREILTDLDQLPAGAARAALDRLQHRSDIKPTRAMTPQELSVISQALGYLTSIDNIVDEAQETLSAFLGVPNPDADETDDMQANSSAPPIQKRTVEQNPRGLSLVDLGLWLTDQAS